MRVIIVDNYDSFTFNLYQMISEITSSSAVVVHNDEVDWQQFKSQEMNCVIISPGPGRPDRSSDFGISSRVIVELEVPILGVCLGHQGICHLFGGAVKHAPEPMHGRVSPVYHDESGLFAGIPVPFMAVRYHSLICTNPLPAEIRKTAWTEDGLIMAVAHRTKPMWGVQFHPESVCTEYGRVVLKNFLNMADNYRAISRASILQKPHMILSRATATPAPDKAAADKKLFSRRLKNVWEVADVFETLFGSEDVAIWLDSAMPDPGVARFSIMAGGAADSIELITFDVAKNLISIRRNGNTEIKSGDIFSYLKTRIAEHRVADAALPFDFNCGFIGFLGYELKASCGYKLVHHSTLPDCSFMYVEKCIVVDHLTNELYFLCLGGTGEEADAWFGATEQALSDLERVDMDHCWQPLSFVASQDREQYLRSIASCLEYIRDGESYEICLTNRLTAKTEADPLAYYYNLRSLNPAPYAAFIRFPGLAVACSSPERFLRVTPCGAVETKPIKGTCRRGRTIDEDRALLEGLASDVKSRAENLMIVDLLRNDLGRVCEVGSVTVPSLMRVESYTTVHQLVSTIRGQLRKDRTAIDCFQAAFPGGSMTGAPKLRTMDIIDQLERQNRGVYSGSIGYFSFNGAADFNIVIRTAVFADQEVTIGVGGAIVAMSDPAEEWEEIMLKAEALLRSFGDYSLAERSA
ncbi:MAG TPA: aminodeoxychorismate synthase component I [Candidatus Angelobacter sp.]|jgi:para-aminobenzoate synthetase|nr:aminodeoxychorismate synthase component I [Candidatus Angelobacter sp.]